MPASEAPGRFVKCFAHLRSREALDNALQVAAQEFLEGHMALLDYTQ